MSLRGAKRGDPEQNSSLYSGQAPQYLLISISYRLLRFARNDKKARSDKNGLFQTFYEAVNSSHMARDFAKYKIYLNGREEGYPFIREMVRFYKGLIDIWDEASPDDLSALFSIERLSRGLYMLDEERIGDLDFVNSAKTARKVIKLIEEQKSQDVSTSVSVSTSDILEFVKNGLSMEDRFTNAILKWILKPSFEHTIEKIKVATTSWNAGRCPICYSPPWYGTYRCI